jgi:hypothetical protein
MEKPVTAFHVLEEPSNSKNSQQFAEEKQQKSLKIEGNHLLAWI